MHLRRLWLEHFRNHLSTELVLDPGVTVLVGANGQGKTNVLEAIGFLATLKSFRGANAEALVMAGQERAVVRGEVATTGRTVLIETEIDQRGRKRAQLNRQRLERSRDLLGALRTTVFAPDDLALVKGGPSLRRDYLDELLVALHPGNQSLVTDLTRILKQRNTLLRQSGGRLDAAAETTLAVWDAKLVEVGEALAGRRQVLVDALSPLLAECYRTVAGSAVAAPVLEYHCDWSDAGLEKALSRSRGDELRRGISLVGPQRDDLGIVLGDLPARTHASQGEQRSIALALRLGGHALVAERTGHDPVVLLDDVFSELDADRASALASALPRGQAVLTTTADRSVPVRADSTIEIVGGAPAVGAS